MLNTIKQKILVSLASSEVLKLVRHHLDLDTKIAINHLLISLTNKIKQAPLPSSEANQDEIKPNPFFLALDDMGEMIQETRNKIQGLNLPAIAFKKINLHLQTLQLNLQNYQYYDAIGINLFTSKQDKPIALENVSTYSYTEYLGISYCLDESTHQHLTPEIINDVTEFSIVYITAPSPNPYGHVLLGLGKQGYVHINALYDKPQYIPVDRFNAYLNAQDRVVLGVQQVHVPHIEAAKSKLQELSKKPWSWGVYWHNCITFTDTILHAGGASYADLDAMHLGNYHGRAQIPIERINHAHPTTLHKTLFDKAQQKTDLQGTHAKLNKHYKQIAKRSGMEKDKAKRYAQCRLEKGLSHEKAQHEADPTWINFFVKHQHKIQCIAVLNPLLFLLVAPLLVITTVKKVNHYRHTLFSEQKEKKEVAPKREDIAAIPETPAISSRA